MAVGALWPVLAGPAAAYASERRWQAALETGPAWQTRNDFRIPGDEGTLVQLAEYEPLGLPPGDLLREEGGRAAAPAHRRHRRLCRFLNRMSFQAAAPTEADRSRSALPVADSKSTQNMKQSQAMARTGLRAVGPAGAGTARPERK